MSRLKTIRDWMVRAQKEHWAIGAFNVGNLETFQAVISVATRLHSPVLIETSPGETSYMGIDNMVNLVATARIKYKLPIFLNLDHATKESDIKQALQYGYDYVHFDGGEYEYKENVRIAKRVIRAAHRLGRVVEAEIDHITGSSKIHTESTIGELQKGELTDPRRAEEFVRSTGCDTFAAFIGNLHGLYTSPKKLDFDRLKEIRKRTSNCFLSLHGGSGISSDQIKKAIALGITKININTEMRSAYLTALQAAVADTKGEAAMYKIMPPVIKAVEKVVTEKIKLFGSMDRC